MDKEKVHFSFPAELDSNPGTSACQSDALTNCASRAVCDFILIHSYLYVIVLPKTLLSVLCDASGGSFTS